MKKYIVGVTLLFLIWKPVYGQDEGEECLQNLEQAQNLYDQGRVQDVEALLVNCVNTNGFEKADLQRALRLMILANIFRGQETKADSLMNVLLHKRHEFIPDQTIDPEEFINLWESYRTKPVFGIGIKLGGNYNVIEVTDIFTAAQPYSNLSSGQEAEYSPLTGFTGSLLFEYEFKERWTLVPEIQYSTKSYGKATDTPSLSDPTSTYDRVDYNENQTWIELPVGVKYRFKDGDFRPYATAGGAVNFLLSSDIPGSTASLNRNEITIQNTLGDVTPEVNQLNFSAFLGGGVKYKFQEGFLFAEARAFYGITHVRDGTYSLNRVAGTQGTQGTLTPSGEDQFLPEGIVHDSFKQHFVTFAAGYILNIYKPKKKTE